MEERKIEKRKTEEEGFAMRQLGQKERNHPKQSHTKIGFELDNAMKKQRRKKLRKKR